MLNKIFSLNSKIKITIFLFKYKIDFSIIKFIKIKKLISIFFLYSHFKKIDIFNLIKIIYKIYLNILIANAQKL